MKIAILVSFQILAAAVPGQRDQFCISDECEYLSIQDGAVKFTDFPSLLRSLVVGQYSENDQHFVPGTEVPIRGLRSSRGWRVVVSVFLRHDEGGLGTRVRLFSPDATLRGEYDGRSLLEQVILGRLFGGADEILAVTTIEEHAYNAETVVWLVPESGGPTQLLKIPGQFRRFVRENAGSAPGVWIDRETYDGEHAETKGYASEFWAWDVVGKRLIRQQ